jgi:hypothetical protein
VEKGGCHVNIPQQGKASFFRTCESNYGAELLNQKISLPRGRGSDKITHMHIFDYALLSFYTNVYIVYAECSTIWLFFKRNIRD